jgi:hypothetical protein
MGRWRGLPNSILRFGFLIEFYLAIHLGVRPRRLIVMYLPAMLVVLLMGFGPFGFQLTRR